MLQVILKYVVADATDNHAHPQNTGKGDGDDSFLDAAGVGFHGGTSLTHFSLSGFRPAGWETRKFALPRFLPCCRRAFAR